MGFGDSIPSSCSEWTLRLSLSEGDNSMRYDFEYAILNPAQSPCQEISDPDKLVKEPIVSVAMITYNHEPYIAKAIEGVINQQTEYPFELIIGEDRSFDRTREIVLEYQKKYPEVVRVLIPERNTGSIKNMLRVEKACHGKYIAYCEGDDYWHNPYKLQRQTDFLENNPDFGLVHGDWDCFNVSTGKLVKNVNRIEGKEYNSEPSNLFVSILELEYYLRTLTVCVRKALLLEVLSSDPLVFENERFLMGDTPRWLELSRVTRFKYINESLGTYNVLAESASHCQDGCKLYEFYLSIFDMVRYYAEKYMPGYNVDSIISRHLTLMLKHAYFNQDSELAKKTMKLASKLNCTQLFLYLGATNQVLHCGLAPFAGLARFVKDLKRKCRTGFSLH